MIDMIANDVIDFEIDWLSYLPILITDWSHKLKK